MHKIKCLHLVEDFKIGGLERVVETIYNGLDRNCFEPYIWCIAGGGDLADQFIRDGKALRVLGFRSYHRPLNIFKLAFLIRRNNFQIVHTHAYFAGTMGRIAAFLAGTPVILNHVHTTYWDFKSRNIIIERMLSKVSDCIICCSDFVRKFVIAKECIPPAKTITIYNGVNDLYGEYGPSKDVKNNKKTVRLIVVASLVENKGHLSLLQAFGKLVQIRPDLELCVIGEGPLRDSLEQTATALGICQQVFFLGIRKDVLKLMAEADIAVLPSLYREGLNLSIIEAMSMAKPVVTTNVGGTRELIEDGVNGFLAQPGNVDELAEKLNLLAGNQELRLKMGAAGRRIFKEKFTASIMIREIESLYSFLLDNKVII